MSDLRLAYLGRSTVTGAGLSQVLSFAPNLLRDPVAFDAPLKEPLRFREAISALHDVVVSDLRFKKRDKTAYQEWKKAEDARLATLRHEVAEAARQDIKNRRNQPIPPDLQKDFNRAVKRYWHVRLKYTSFLQLHDPALWRLLTPCDPVITVAPDVVFFEGFSLDQSSYGCLSVDRETGFGLASNVQCGTTNVDYSQDLYEHFQGLRSYRETRFTIDPQGFSVKTSGHSDYREEKIDLPPGWLRGFMRLQSAMGLPMRKVVLRREAVYSILVWLTRHRARQSPRALRVELVVGQAPRIVLEPWEVAIEAAGPAYDGTPTAPIRIWGRNRLLVLSRLLPLADSVELYLLGSGYPSFWVIKMGEMRFTLGLSGWTTNDWSAGGAIEQLSATVDVTAKFIDLVGQFVREKQRATLEEITQAVSAGPVEVGRALRQLAGAGQLIHDLPGGVYRWRQVMPVALGEAQLGPEDPETKGAREILAARTVTIGSKQDAGRAGVLIVGHVGGKYVEVLVDGDGVIKRGKCDCSHHFRGRLTRGPCRHLQALRQRAWTEGGDGKG
jgi:hypothetical protein